MSKKITKLFLIAICFVSSAIIQKVIAQQTVNWSVVQLVDGTEVLTEGTLKEAINFSGGATDLDHNTTINTVLFNGKASGVASGNAFANPTTTHLASTSQNVVPFNVDQYDVPSGIAVYDELLSRFLWNVGGAATVTLSGLELGKSYKVQFFMGDKRDNQSDSFIVLGVQGGTPFGSSATTKFAGQTTTSGIVINGAFVAQSTSFVLDMSKDLNGVQGFNLNAYQLREVASLSVNDVNSINFNLYPNPARKSFSISMNNGLANNSKITISNIAGQVVYKGELNNKITSIGISNLSPGLYLVQVKGGHNDTFFSKKLVIE